MDLKKYEKIASKIRTDVINEVHSAGSGHPGGSLSAADIVTALYFREMNIDPKKPDMKGRDKFIPRDMRLPCSMRPWLKKDIFPKKNS